MTKSTFTPAPDLVPLVLYQEDMSYKTALQIITLDREPAGLATVVFEDGELQLPIRSILIQLPIWAIYRTMGKHVYKRHAFIREPGIFNKKTWVKIYSKIYDELYAFKMLKEALWISINQLNDYGIIELAEYHETIDAVGLSNIVDHPSVKNLIHDDFDETNGTAYVEKELKRRVSELITKLGTRGLIPDNDLLNFIETDCLSKRQVGQVLIAYGYRTEINDRIIKKFIRGSSLFGLNDTVEFICDNCGARKAVYYSHDAIRMTQYHNRKNQLVGAAIARLYKDACKTQNTISFTLPSDDLVPFYGKFVVDPDDASNVVAIVPGEEDRFYNRKVQMFSPITCEHTNGICSRCFGLLAKNYTSGSNIGIAAASRAISSVSQQILSTKHVDNTASMTYELPTPADLYFRRGTRGIVPTQKLLALKQNTDIGISYKSFRGSLTDLSYNVDATQSVPEDRLTTIPNITLRINGNGKDKEYVDLTFAHGGRSPFLSIEFLTYIKKHFDEVEQDLDAIWVPLKYLKDDSAVILKSVIYNNSTMVLVDNIISFLDKPRLAKYTDANAALADFSEMIFERISGINIVQLEIILKAHLVTSATNWSIPIVKDTKNVKFSTTKAIILNRTISGAFAFEAHNKWLQNPRTYTTLTDEGPFDTFF